MGWFPVLASPLWHTGRRLLTAALWLLVAGAVLVIAGSLAGRPLLVAAVAGESMLPSLRPGDLVPLLPPWLAGEPGPGDVIVFRSPQVGAWVVHRVVAGDSQQGFLTQGDANPEPDPGLVPAAAVAGVVPTRRGVPLRLLNLGATGAGRRWLWLLAGAAALSAAVPGGRLRWRLHLLYLRLTLRWLL